MAPDLKITLQLPLEHKPKLFFCDVDRTLLTHDHRLLPTVKAAMRALGGIQLPIILASARSPTGVEKIRSEVGASDIACCFNGAWIGHAHHRKTLKEMRLNRDLAIDAMLRVHDAGGSPIWFDIDCCYTLATDELVARRRTGITGDKLKTIDAPIKAPGEPLKLLAMFPENAITGAVETLSSTFLGKLTVTQSGPNLIELVSTGVGKCLAASFVAGLYSLNAADVVAAGDSENDLELLNWAGLAITVSNAKQHIQRAADVVAPSCDEGGLASAIDWLINEVSACKSM